MVQTWNTVCQPNGLLMGLDLKLDRAITGLDFTSLIKSLTRTKLTLILIATTGL